MHLHSLAVAVAGCLLTLPDTVQAHAGGHDHHGPGPATDEQIRLLNEKWGTDVR